LVIDPHYSGLDTAEEVVKGRGCFWARSTYFRRGVFYNLVLGLELGPSDGGCACAGGTGEHTQGSGEGGTAAVELEWSDEHGGLVAAAPSGLGSQEPSGDE
jgi:hypothetical protein